MTIQYESIKNEAWNFIGVHSYDDAHFLAELLNAEAPSEESQLILVTVYFHLGKFKVVKDIFEKCEYKSPKLCLLYAKACIELEKYADAEKILTRDTLRSSHITCTIAYVKKNFKELSSEALYDLATVYLQTERSDRAEKCLRESLQANPLKWTSFVKLCQITSSESKPNPDEYFNAKTFSHLESESNKVNTSLAPVQTEITKKKKTATKVLMPIGPNTETLESYSTFTTHSSDFLTNKFITPTPIHNVSSCDESHIKMDMERLSHSGQIESSLIKLPSEGWDTTIESTASDSISSTNDRRQTRTQMRIAKSLLSRSITTPKYSPNMSGIVPIPETPESVGTAVGMTTPTDQPNIPSKIAPKKMVTRQSRRAAVDKTKVERGTGKLLFTSTPSASSEPQVTTRRSSRISAISSGVGPGVGGSLKENTKKINRKTTSVRELKKPIRIKKGDGTSTPVEVINVESTIPRCIATVIRQIGYATVAMSRFKCKQVVSLLKQLPDNYVDIPSVLLMTARACFEGNDYKKSRKVFEDLRSKHPHYLKGMSLYSSCLWHLADQIALSTLANDLYDIDPTSAETWCAIGNCFSLQRDNLTAIKFFSRAVQQDRSHAYARTLLGHEYTAVEDTDRAKAAFENAASIDPNHYNAWYGIGMIYYRMESYPLAETYLNRAISINGSSAILFCQKAMAEHAQQRSAEALETLNQALRIEPRNALCMFNRATILFSVEKHDQALTELNALCDIVPKESVVYFLIGKIHMAKGQSHLATLNFTHALELDPKGVNNHIKEAIENCKPEGHSHSHDLSVIPMGDLNEVSSVSANASSTLLQGADASLPHRDDFPEDDEDEEFVPSSEEDEDDL